MILCINIIKARGITKFDYFILFYSNKNKLIVIRQIELSVLHHLKSNIC